MVTGDGGEVETGMTFEVMVVRDSVRSFTEEREFGAAAVLLPFL